jgi:aminoglycoside 6'-N-acetyltransferase
MTQGYIIYNENIPVGYIKTYLIRDYPEYYQYLGINDNPAAFDLFIADAYQGRGIGLAAITKFINDYIFSNPAIDRIVLGPAANNSKVIKLNEKAGFKFLKLVSVPGEASQEYLMELLKKS